MTKPLATLRRRLRALMLRPVRTLLTHQEKQLLAVGRMLADRSRKLGRINSLAEAEFRIFSQFGDDDIIQWLIGNTAIPSQVFVEFGVQDYTEANTRFLLLNDNWSGLVIDSSDANIDKIVVSAEYWQHNLHAKAAFITASNINALIESGSIQREIGILSVDIDGNDYWIWKALTCVDPVIVIIEYNSTFGNARPISVPYDAGFRRGVAHYSHLYWGASLPALVHLSAEKGYAFIGCNSAGNNAFFVRRNNLNERVRETTALDGYVLSKFRESRDAIGQLSYLSGDARLAAIKGMPVINVTTGETEFL